MFFRSVSFDSSGHLKLDALFQSNLNSNINFNFLNFKRQNY